MNEELRSIYEKLKSLSEYLATKSQCDEFLELSEEEYIEGAIEKPQKQKLLPTAYPSMKNVWMSLLWFAAFGAGLALFFTLTVNAFKNDADAMFSGFMGLLMIICAIGTFVRLTGIFSALKKRNEEIAICKENEKKNVEIKNYNEVVYPEKLKEYNEEATELRTKFIDLQEEIKNKMPMLEAELEKLSGVISERYYDDLDTIIEIIEEGRADSLKEAINVLKADQQAERLLQEQREMEERIAREQARAAQAAALAQQQAIREMQLQEKKAADMARWKENRDYARERRKEVDDYHKAMRSCRHCAHFAKCRKTGTLNCAAYQPK